MRSRPVGHRPEQVFGFILELIANGKIDDAKGWWNREGPKRFARGLISRVRRLSTDEPDQFLVGRITRWTRGSENHHPMAWVCGYILEPEPQRNRYRTYLNWWWNSQNIWAPTNPLAIGLTGSEIFSDYMVFTTTATLLALVEAIKRGDTTVIERASTFLALCLKFLNITRTSKQDGLFETILPGQREWGPKSNIKSILLSLMLDAKHIKKIPEIRGAPWLWWARCWLSIFEKNKNFRAIDWISYSQRGVDPWLRSGLTIFYKEEWAVAATLEKTVNTNGGVNTLVKTIEGHVWQWNKKEQPLSEGKNVSTSWNMVDHTIDVYQDTTILLKRIPLPPFDDVQIFGT